ncbi:MAG: gliding motility-associated protein GldE [Chlorobi bacterium]|nr:gliding motility-associated protein GldE [Chlorobiota bacterium]
MLVFIKLNISFLSFHTETYIGAFIILFLLTISALISGSEVAYFSLSPYQKELLKSKKSKSGRLVIKFLEKPEKLLATILVANNFVNIGIVLIAAYLTNQIFDFTGSETIGFLIKIVFITFLILLAGEIIPKVYANENALKVSLFMAIPIYFLDIILWPVSAILLKSTTIVKKRFQKKENISMDELSQALDLTTGAISEDKKLLKGIVEFGNIEVTEIKKSRIDVIAVDISTPFKKLMKVVVSYGFSRIPIYEETFDRIKGVLYVKDLLPHLKKGDTFRWQSLIRPPYFVPETKKINDLLKEFQTRKIHLAIVIDEYGGTSGIVSMEDILEEIIGEIKDEFDEEEKIYTKLNDRTYIFEGKTLLNDFYKIVNANPEIFEDKRGEADTIAGMILEIKGEIPKAKEIIEIKNFTFTIEEVNNRRIKKIKVTIKK